MKKIYIIAFFLLAAGIIAISPNGEMAKTAIATSTGGLFIPPAVDTINNYNIKVDGKLVVINWSSNRFMDGFVSVNSNAGSDLIVESGGEKTYHTVSFYLAPGKYEIQPYSTLNFQTYKLPIKNITIEIDDESEIKIPEIIVNNNLEWKRELTNKQKEELIKLSQKPKEQWSDFDISNWNYAVK